jgi:hypothetical protein
VTYSGRVSFVTLPACRDLRCCDLLKKYLTPGPRYGR